MGNMSNSELQVTRQRPEDYFATAANGGTPPIVLPSPVEAKPSADPNLIAAIVAIVLIVALIIFVLAFKKDSSLTSRE